MTSLILATIIQNAAEVSQLNRESVRLQRQWSKTLKFFKNKGLI